MKNVEINLKLVRYYNQAIKIKPNFAEAYYRMGILNLGLGDPISDIHYEIYRKKAIEDLEISKKFFTEQGKQMPEVSNKSDSHLQIILKNDTNVKYGTQISIKACNGEYIMSRLNHHGELAARAKHINEWEKFEIVSTKDSFLDNKNRAVYYGDKVAFRAITNNKFVCSDLKNHGRLIANAPHVKEWEIFTLLPFQDDKKLGENIEYGNNFILQVHDNKQVYCELKEYGRICINSPQNNELEVFVFIRSND